MGTFSPTHWFIALIMITPLLLLLIVPTWRILQRAGFNGAWALLMLVPVVGLLVPWVVSFLKWPSDRDYKTSTSKGGVIAGFVLLPLAVGVLALMVNVAIGPAGLAISSGEGKPSTSTNPFSDPNFGKQGAPNTLTYEEAYGLPAKR